MPSTHSYKQDWDPACADTNLKSLLHKDYTVNITKANDHHKPREGKTNLKKWGRTKPAAFEWLDSMWAVCWCRFPSFVLSSAVSLLSVFPVLFPEKDLCCHLHQPHCLATRRPSTLWALVIFR